MGKAIVELKLAADAMEARFSLETLPKSVELVPMCGQQWYQDILAGC